MPSRPASLHPACTQPTSQPASRLPSRLPSPQATPDGKLPWHLLLQPRDWPPSDLALATQRLGLGDQQVLGLLESMIVLVDMANKYIFLICQTSPPSFHMLLKLNRISRRCGECYWLAYAAIEFIPAMTHLLGVYALVYITVNIRWYRMESPAATLTLAQFN